MNAEPTLAATRRAAEEVRAANHAAYDAPTGDPGNVDDRIGALYDLLSRSEQLARDLSRDSGRLADAPGLRATDGSDAIDRARQAATRVLFVGQELGRLAQIVNAAWSDVSPLHIAEQPNEGEDGAR